MLNMEKMNVKNIEDFHHSTMIAVNHNIIDTELARNFSSRKRFGGK